MTPATATASKGRYVIEGNYPEITLDHLDQLTDRTGIIQHAIYSIPNRRTGYCTDDNARALIVAVCHHDATGSRESLRLVSTYLSFCHYAKIPNGKFHNFMSFDQVFLDGEGSEDCQGRTLWALGQCLAAKIHDNVKEVARNLFRDALWVPESLSYLRSRSYAALGLALYLQAHQEEEVADVLRAMADSIADTFEVNATTDWEWFENGLTYSNPLMPRALFMAYQALGDERYLQIAERSWAFLEKQCVIDGIVQIIGCNGWYYKGRERAWFDQQPIDAMMMVLGALDGLKATGNPHYLDTAKLCLDWFMGKNALGVPLHDPVTGGCFDGLAATGRNGNQGAESTISGLLTQIIMAPYIKDGQSLFVEK
ncbi:MAG: glycosyltransferase [Armatimonadetes bacterium]|nr:glycosyltransferase [Armatimonadota bacterium]